MIEYSRIELGKAAKNRGFVRDTYEKVVRLKEILIFFNDNIKVEINYSLRTHIFEPVKRKIITDAFEDTLEIRTLEPMEIFAAKTNALLSRAAARDLYDFNNMIFYGLFDESEYELFRKCIVFYASISAEIINKTLEENEYLNAFGRKEYKPELLFTNKDILHNIRNHPMAVWKMNKEFTG